MWYHVLYVFLITFGSLGYLSSALNASDAECGSVKRKLAISGVRDYITCHHDVWLRPDGNHTNQRIIMYVDLPAFIANFDEDSSVLHLHSWMVVDWMDDRLAWDPEKFGNVTEIKIPKPDIAIISADNDDIYNYRLNRTTCIVYSYRGHAVCLEQVHHKIRCQTDFTLWPYDRQNCTLLITSWSHSAEQLTLTSRGFPQVNKAVLKSNEDWNLSVARISYDLKRSHYYYKNMFHPQISIDFVIDRLYSNAKGRFAASAIIMMVMTLITLWLDPKSIERLAISSLNIIIHMMCVRDLHRALPQNGTTVPNMLLFYVNSFVLAILALLLTYVLLKIEDTKLSAPKWILSITDRILKSKAGKILMLCMLDPKTTAGIETGADDNSDILISGPRKFNWKYVAIFFGWILFFSFFFVYVLMYVLLIPNSSSRPPKVPIFVDSTWGPPN